MIKVVDLFVQDADKPDILATCVLKMRQPHDHFLPMQAISAACIRLSCFFRKCLWPALTPVETQAPGNRDAIDKDRVVFIERFGITVFGDYGIIMRLAVWLLITQGGIVATYKDSNITAILPYAWTDGVALPAFNGQIASLQIKEQRLFNGKRPEQ